MDRFLLISADCHAGPLPDQARAYVDGARVLAQVLGYAASGDAANIVQPTENADGAQRCMRLALADAGLQPDDVDYLNPHATSTPAGDPARGPPAVGALRPFRRGRRRDARGCGRPAARPLALPRAASRR